MARRAYLVALALAAAGILSIVASIITGSTRVFLVLIVPVLTSSSALFGIGVLMLFASLVVVALSGRDWDEGGPTASSPPSDPDGTEPSQGGFLLIGPVPIFFGAARSLDDRYYWVAVGAGVALFAGLAAILFFA